MFESPENIVERVITKKNTDGSVLVVMGIIEEKFVDLVSGKNWDEDFDLYSIIHKQVSESHKELNGRYLSPLDEVKISICSLVYESQLVLEADYTYLVATIKPRFKTIYL